MVVHESRVSVALCTFNGAQFLREQLDSIAAQSRQLFELIICDDASTDATVTIAEAFAASAPFPVRIHRNPATLGVTSNYDRAIAICSGELIALADQDDVWRQDKLEHLHSALTRDPAPPYAFSDARLIGADAADLGGKSLLARRFTLASIRSAFANGRELDLMLKRDFIYGTTLMFRAEYRDLFQPIPPSWSHDTWIVNVLAFHGLRGMPVFEPLVRYRQHAVQASGGTADPRRIGYSARVKAYEDLRTMLAASPRPIRSDALPRIDEKLRYLRAMVAMQQASIPGRARIVAREIASGRWLRYTPRTFLVDKRIDPSSLRSFRA